MWVSVTTPLQTTRHIYLPVDTQSTNTQTSLCINNIYFNHIRLEPSAFTLQHQRLRLPHLFFDFLSCAKNFPVPAVNDVKAQTVTSSIHLINLYLYPISPFRLPSHDRRPIRKIHESMIFPNAACKMCACQNLIRKSMETLHILNTNITHKHIFENVIKKKYFERPILDAESFNRNVNRKHQRKEPQNGILFFSFICWCI